MQSTKLVLTTGPGINPTQHGDGLVLDWDRKQIIDKLRFTHGVYDNSHKGLAGGTWHGETLLVATECELLELSVAPLRLREVRSFPFLNDVHHLAAHGDRIWVCNTGLDCVEELDTQWQVLETHDLINFPGRRLRYAVRSLRETMWRGWQRIRYRQKRYPHLPVRPPFRNTRKLLVKNAYRKQDRELRYSFFRNPNASIRHQYLNIRLMRVG